MQIVIPSKGRSKTIGGRTLRLTPDAIVCVAESEVQDYKREIPDACILSHPDDVCGIGPLREWIVQNISDHSVIMIDDDVKYVSDITGIKARRIEDPEHVQAILERACIASKDAGCRLFGYGQSATAMAYESFYPIALSTWIGAVVGVHGKDMHYDKTLLLRCDIDFSLKSLLKERIVWCDNRYRFIHDCFSGVGGNNTIRSAERHQAETNRLIKRLGKHLKVSDFKSQTRIAISVPR
jgi:hypothetical protein